MSRGERAQENPAVLLMLGAGIAALGVAGVAMYALSKGPQAKMLSIAASQLGVTETDTNRGPMVDVYNQSAGVPLGSSWCGSFVSWVLKQAGIATKPIASVQAIHDKAKALGVITDKPSAGAVFVHVTGTGIIDPDKGWDHTGFVLTTLPLGKWQSIEGNASNKVKSEEHPRSDESAVGHFLFVPFSALSKVFAP